MFKIPGISDQLFGLGVEKCYKMKSVFMVAEKPSLAASVAKLLSDGKANPSRGNCPQTNTI